MKTSLQFAACVLLLTFAACKSKTSEEKFNPHVLAFTSGNVSVESRIIVRLAETVEGIGVGETINENLFDFSPSIKGQTLLTDEQTFEFIPESRMKPGQSYSVKFNVGKAIRKGVEKENRMFDFSFQTIKPSFHLVQDGLQLYDENGGQMYFLSCEVHTADYANNADVEKMLSVSGIKMPVKWEHENNRSHRFTIDSIKTGEKSFEIKLGLNAKSINGSKTEDVAVRVPSMYEFSFLGAEVKDADSEQYVVCRFSSPIDTKQSLTGIVSLNDYKYNYRIVRNTIVLYP